MTPAKFAMTLGLALLAAAPTARGEEKETGFLPIYEKGDP